MALKLAARARKGQKEDLIRLPVVEGENRRADRNQLIGYLVVKGSEIERDLPVGTEIEITIRIDQTRLVHTEAFVPLLCKEYRAELQMGKRVFTQDELAADIAREKQRYEEIREKVQVAGDAKAIKILERIVEENAVEQIERALDAANSDPDAADKCHKRLLGLKAAVDELEERMKIPDLVAEGYQMIEWTEEVVTNYGKPNDNNQFEVQRRELLVALEARVVDHDQLFRKIDRMDDLRMKVLTSRPEWWLDYLARLQDARDRMVNQALADQLIAQATNAVNADDLEGVKAACRQLCQLLPSTGKKLAGEFSLIRVTLPANATPIQSQDTVQPPDGKSKRTVFISYRRIGEGAIVAKYLRAELRQRGCSVFLDVDSLGTGHFDEALLKEIEDADNFLVIMSVGCFDRCRNHDDWFRKEMAHAISRNKNILPILMDGFVYPELESLPEDIRTVKRHHGIRYTHEYSDAMMDKIDGYLR